MTKNSIRAVSILMTTKEIEKPPEVINHSLEQN